MTDAKHKYMFVSEVAAEFRVSEGAVYTGIRDGRIPALRILNRVLVPRDWVENQTASYGPVIDDEKTVYTTKTPERVTITSRGDVVADVDLAHWDSRGCE